MIIIILVFHVLFFIAISDLLGPPKEKKALKLQKERYENWTDEEKLEGYKQK